ALDVVRTVLLAGIIAAGVGPWAGWLHRKALPPNGWHVPVAVGVLIVYLGALAGIILVGVIAVPPIVTQTQELVHQAPEYAARVQSFADGISSRYPWLPPLQIGGDQL